MAMQTLISESYCAKYDSLRTKYDTHTPPLLKSSSPMSATLPNKLRAHSRSGIQWLSDKQLWITKILTFSEDYLVCALSSHRGGPSWSSDEIPSGHQLSAAYAGKIFLRMINLFIHYWISADIASCIITDCVWTISDLIFLGQPINSPTKFRRLQWHRCNSLSLARVWNVLISSDRWQSQTPRVSNCTVNFCLMMCLVCVCVAWEREGGREGEREVERDSEREAGREEEKESWHCLTVWLTDWLTDWLKCQQ